MAATNPYPSVSLYIGELHPDVTETMLFEVFKTVGSIASLRVCRDTITRRSLGYGYINFHNPADAERALDTMNYTLIKGRSCRIMWSHRDPSLRKSGVGNIFIKNLDKSIDHKALNDTFSVFGSILSCKVAVDENGNSKGYGFVHYETQEAADLAVLKSNGKLLNGKIVYVGPFQPRKDRSNTSGEESEKKFTNIFVKNLDTNVTDDELRAVFAKHGAITSCVVMKDDSGASKGFGFVNFETPEAAKSAVDETNGKVINDKAIYVGRAQKRSEREQELRAKFEQLKQERLAKTAGVNLFIKNLDDSVDDAKLKADFASFGTITSAKVMVENGVSKGFGFVCFTTPEEATKALTEMNGRMVNGKPLYVGLAQRKDVRRATLENTHRPQNFARVGYQYPNHIGAFYPPQPGMPQRGGYIAGFPHQNLVRPRWSGNPTGAIPNRGPNPFPANYAGGVPSARGGRARRGASAPVQPVVVNGRSGAPASAPANPAADTARGFKWTKDARNKEVQEAAAAAVPEAAAAPAPSTEDRKNQLCESLYPLIEAVQPELVGRITGMFEDSLSITELIELLESTTALNAKIAEAVEVLQAAAKKEEQQ